MSLHPSKTTIIYAFGSSSRAVAKQGPAELVTPVLIGVTPFYPIILCVFSHLYVRLLFL